MTSWRCHDDLISGAEWAKPSDGAGGCMHHRGGGGGCGVCGDVIEGVEGVEGDFGGLRGLEGVATPSWGTHKKLRSWFF